MDRVTLRWEQVRDYRDRRRVAYWRLGSNDWSPGTVARAGSGFRASGSPHPERGHRHRDRVDLGTYARKRDAERAVEEFARTLRTAESP